MSPRWGCGGASRSAGVFLIASSHALCAAEPNFPSINPPCLASKARLRTNTINRAPASPPGTTGKIMIERSPARFGVRRVLAALSRRLVAVEQTSVWKSSEPLDAALPGRPVGQAPKAVTSHRMCLAECGRPRPQKVPKGGRRRKCWMPSSIRPFLRPRTGALR
jgi:hypothetical protein